MKKNERHISFKQDPDNFFRVEHLTENLKQRSVRGGLITLLAQVFKFSMTLGSNIILTRLLTPEDYGLIGMVSAVTGFFSLFKDFGLSMATIQKSEINHKQVSNLFWINVVIGIIIASILTVFSPFISEFYNEPRVTQVTTVLAIGIFISSLGIQHIALLNRQMKYTEILWNDTVALILANIAAIVSAIYGLGYWSLVIMPIMLTTSTTIGAWITCRWRPGLPSRNSGVRSMFSFGSYLTGFSIINYFARNLDNVLIGKFWGLHQLGLYTRAYQLFLLPLSQINSPMTSVAIPTLSRLLDSPEKYRKTYIRLVEKIVLITMPFVVFCILASDWIIQIFFGQQWLEASNIFTLLGFSGILQPVANSIGWLCISQGNAVYLFKWGILSSVITVSSFFVGLRWGALGVAAAYSVMINGAVIPIMFWFFGKMGPVKMRDFYSIIHIPVLVSCFALVIGGILKYYVNFPNPMVNCLVFLCLVLIMFFSMISLSAKWRQAIQDLNSLIGSRI